MADPLDILGRRRNGGPLRNALADQNAADPAVLDQVDAYNLDQQSAFARGAQAGAYGMTAGSFADEALNAQLAGNDAAQRALEEQALANAQRAGQVAPRVRSLRDVGSVGDFGELVGGHLGQAAATMAPVLGAGLLTRGRSMPRASAFAGATIPAYQLEQGEAILGQLSDPELAGMDPQRRAELARNKAIVNAGLESLVPAGLVSKVFGRGSPLRTVGDSMLTEGLTETLQEGTGFLAEETLRQGSLDKALQTPVDDELRMRLADAGFAGAVGGGGLSLPTAGTQALANAAARSAELGKTAAKKTVETAGAATDTAGEQAKNLRQWADKHLEGLELDQLDDDQLVSELERRSSDPEIVPRDPTDDLVRDAVRRGDLDAVQAAMAQREENAPNLRQQAAAKLLEQDDVPPPLQEMATRVMQGQASMEDEAQILGQAAGYQAGRAAKTLAARGIVAVDEAISFGKEALADGAKAVRDIRKRNEQEGAEAPGLVNALFSQLKPEFRKDPEINKRLSSMVSLFANLDGQEDTTGTYDTVRRLAPALSWFENPAKALPKGLAKVYADVTRAQTEAQSDDSWLTSNLTPAFQGKPAARAEVGRLIDRAALGEELGPREAQLLQRAFGSKGATQTMLRHYKMQLPLLRRERPEVEEQLELDQTQEAEDQESGEENPDYDSSRQGMTEKQLGETKVAYHFATQDDLPYLRLRQKDDDGREFTPVVRAMREAQSKDKSRTYRPMDMLQYARERGLEPAELAETLRQGYNERREQEKTTEEEEFLFEQAEFDDELLLKKHQVLRSEQADNSNDLVFNDDRELHEKARTLVDQVKNAKGPAAKAAMKATHITVKRKKINRAGKETERPTVYSAESLWKYYGDKLMARQKGGEASLEDGKPQAERAKDLFARAIAELALDGNVTEIVIPEGTVIDRATGTKVPGRVESKHDPKYRAKRDAAAKAAKIAFRQERDKAREELKNKEFEKRLRAAFDRPGLDTRDALERTQADLDQTMDEASATPNDYEYNGVRMKPWLLERARIIREVMRDVVDERVPYPDLGETLGEGRGETSELFADKANEAVHRHGAYLEDLIELAGDLDLFAAKVAAARRKQDQLEVKALEQEFGAPLPVPSSAPSREAAEALSDELQLAREELRAKRGIRKDQENPQGPLTPRQALLRREMEPRIEALALDRAEEVQNVIDRAIKAGVSKEKLLEALAATKQRMDQRERRIKEERSAEGRLPGTHKRDQRTAEREHVQRLTDKRKSNPRAVATLDLLREDREDLAARALAQPESRATQVARENAARNKKRIKKASLAPGKKPAPPAPTPAQAYKAKLKNNAMAEDIHKALGRKGIAASHDSPHRFDGKFDWRTHAFKGEGAMSYGAGTYLSTSDGVHKHYKEKFTAQIGGVDEMEIASIQSNLESEQRKLDKLLAQAKDVPGDNGSKFVGRVWFYLPGGFVEWEFHDKVFASEEEARSASKASIEKVNSELGKLDAEDFGRKRADVWPLEELLDVANMNIEVLKDDLEEILNESNGAGRSPTYQVSVEANDGDILDWDLPFDKQHPEVQEKLAEIAEVAPVEGTDVELGANRKFTIGTAVVGRVQKTALGNWGLYTSDRFAPISQAPTSMDAEEAAQYFWEEFQEGKHDKYLQAFMTPTGESIYRALQAKLGSQEKASDFLQAAGIVGHKFASSGSRDDTHPNYVIYDDSKITTNAVSFNKQSRKKSGIGISRELKNEIAAEIKRITGVEKVRKHLFFVKASEIGGASGQYNPAQRAIRVAISSVDPLGVAYHEALHDFVAGLQESKEGRELRKALFKAGEMPHIRAQLKELLKDHPKALEAIETDAEERIAYLFQFYAVGKHAGKEVIKVRDPATLNALGRLAQWIRELLGVVSQDAKVEAVLEALYDGRMAERNVVGAVVQDMGLLTMQDKFRRLAGPLADVYDKLMLTATDRLRDFGVEPLDELADMMHREPGREKGGLPFLPRRAQRAAQFDNRKAALFDKSTAAERATALRNLQSMQEPSTPLEREVRKLLDDLYDYMDEAGVRRLKPKQKPNESAVWEKIPRVKNYFPRHWDPNKILGNEAEFKALLAKHGNVSLPQQNAIVQAVVHGTHDISLADSEYHVGYTPFAQAVENRRLDFINESNAAEFAKFQQGDLADILSGYIHQAVHRAEFARDFGNAGEVIQQHLQEAAKNLDGKQVAEAGNAVKALVGTLGADVNPRLKDIMSAAITAQNVILLPLTMFSQFIDALGVGLRAQAPEEAWSAFKRGMGDFAKATRKKTREQPDYDTEMAKTLGLIDEQNMLEAMGQAHAGAFMSGFARNINRKFFRWNGMESWNKSMRVSAMVAGERFIQREIANDRYMHELGLEPNDPAIMVKPDGRLAVTAEQMIALGAKPKQAAAREQKIQAALFRFVDGAVLRPNAAQRPVWGSDPHWMLIFHLKQFAFAFQKTILARVNNEFEHGKMMPAAILAAYVPVTMASGLAKATLTGQPIGDGSMLDILNYGVMRSGILGAQSFSADAFSDIERGHLPGTSLIGPTMEHAFTASRFVVGDPEIDAGRVLDRSLPFARYF